MKPSAVLPSSRPPCKNGSVKTLSLRLPALCAFIVVLFTTKVFILSHRHSRLPTINHLTNSENVSTISTSNQPPTTPPCPTLSPTSPMRPYTSPLPNLPPSLHNYLTWHAEARMCLTSPATCSNPPPVLLFRCLPNRLCAGLGDRFRGILFNLLLAISTHRLFLIDWPAGPHSPYPLTTVLHPSLLDWRLPPNWTNLTSAHPVTQFNWYDAKNWNTLPIVAHNATLSDKLFVADAVARNLTVDLISDDFPSLTKQYNILAIANNAPHRLLYFALANKYIVAPIADLSSNMLQPTQLLRLLLRILFKPSPTLQSAIDGVAFPSGAPYVGVHARTGVDFAEDTLPRFANVTSDEAITATSLLNCASKVLPSTSRRLYLASDSRSLKATFRSLAAQRRLYVHALSGRAVHVGLPAWRGGRAAMGKGGEGEGEGEALVEVEKERKCSAFVETFVDVFMLAGAEGIVTTGSGFAKAAWHFGNGSRFLIGFSGRKKDFCAAALLD